MMNSNLTTLYQLFLLCSINCHEKEITFTDLDSTREGKNTSCSKAVYFSTIAEEVKKK
jgi:hypothetical protein